MVKLLIILILGIQTGVCSSKNAIETASINVGVPYAIMYKIAKLESNLNPKARNKTSSAKGLFQIIKPTEIYLRHKYNIKGSIFNPYVNSLLGAYNIKLTIKYYNKYKIKATELNLYLAHFFGNRGAYRVLSFKDTTIVCKVLRTVCRYNKFLKNKTVKQIKNYFNVKLNRIRII